YVLADFVFGELPGREFLERASHERCTFWIGNQTLAGGPSRIQVTKGSEERPASELQGRLHAATGSLGAHVVVELRESGEHALHQLACRRVVDRLGCGAQRDAERFEMRPQREVVVLLSSEARQAEDDNELDRALALATELQQLLQLGTIRGLSALTF